jgi:DNA repair protein RecN (Recombination protein N)
MLSLLSISNYALIDSLEIKFPAGLTLITGETGAGKSILLGALGLIIGQRADTGVLQDKSKKCTVEAVFNLKGMGLEAFFKQNDLDYDDSSTIRREINPEGKSRAFINDTPVTLLILKSLGEKLLDIHSQHQTLTLNDSDFQLSVLDAYAGNTKDLQDYHTGYKAFRALESKLTALHEQENASKRDQDYFQFQLNELEEAKLDSLRQADFESELELLNHAEEIKKALGKASSGLTGGELNILSSLAEVKGILAQLAKYNAGIAGLTERITSSFIELKDIGNEIESLEGGIVYDPERVEELEQVLDALYKLQLKHQVKTTAELIALREDFANRLLGISTLEAEIRIAEKELKGLLAGLSKKAEQLALKRRKAAPGIEKELRELLAQVGMPDASLQARCIALPEGHFDATGNDRVNFLFSANKGGELKELSKIASGGELSRLMLSIKSLVAKRSALPTLIFDEIDTGVSGDVADKVGNIMEAMATGMQVVTITHLPQIACKGGSHLFVYKEIRNGKTYTRIRTLEKEERIQEIAKMLSTGQPTPAALKNAKELLSF